MASSLQASSSSNSGSKLGRSNAKKNIPIFSTPDSTAHASLGHPASFRILGMGSHEIRMIGDQIGIRGGPEEWGISPAEWRKGKILSNPEFMSKSMDEGPDDGDWLRSGARNIFTTSLGSASFDGTSTSYRDAYDNGRRYSRSDRITDDPTRAPCKIESHKSERKPHLLMKHDELIHHFHDERRRNQGKDGGVILHEESTHSFGAEQRENQDKDGMDILHHRNEYEACHLIPSTSGGSEVKDNGNLQVGDDNEVDFNNMRKHLDGVERADMMVQRPLLPPPPVRVNVSFSMLSTHELLESFGPEKDQSGEIDDHINSSDGESSNSDSESDLGELVNDQHQEAVSEPQIPNWKDTRSKDQDSPLSKELRRKASAIRVSTSDITICSWKKLELLGSGSFGTVYEGLSEEGIYFAVKEVSLMQYDSKVQMSVKQLEQEIKFLSKFRHENIVRYLGSQRDPDKLYIFLELVSKGSLASVIRKHQLFDSQIRRYTRQILCGLKYLHDQNIMHRDIKCANILVDINGKIKVADFGLAKQISSLDELKSCKGSAFWMAPEVINPTKTYSFPADIWSLGCTVLEMVTRRPPFGDLEWSRAMWKIGHGEGPPIPQDLPEDARDFVGRCLVVNPAKRPTAAQLLEHPFVQNVTLTPRNSLP